MEIDITRDEPLDEWRPPLNQPWLIRHKRPRLETTQDSMAALYKMNDYLTDALYDGTIGGIDISFFDMMVFNISCEDGQLVLWENGKEHKFKILYDVLEFIVDNFLVDV